MSKARPTAYQKFYWSDYFGDTYDLDGIQSGAYLHLIGWSWMKGQAPLDDDALLARITKLTMEQWLSVRPALEPFFVIASGLWRHTRIEHDLVEAHKSYSKVAERSHRGGEAKWTGAAGDIPTTRSGRLAHARSLGTHTKEQWEDMLVQCGHKCVRCGVHAANTPDGLCKDHIKPIYQGGSDAIENLQPLCRKCNSSKGPEAIDHRNNACLMPAKRLPDACQPKPEPTPEPIKKEKTLAPAALALDGFDDFWAAYSRRDSRRNAQKAWPAALQKVGGDPSIIVRAAKAYSRQFITGAKSKEFQAMPASWLNGERWTDSSLLKLEAPELPRQTTIAEDIAAAGALIEENPVSFIPSWFKGS